VPDAVEYEIEIRGGSVEMAIRLTADEAHCGHGSGLWQDLEVCSWKPAEQWPALEPEKVVFLRLGSRRAATAPLQQGRELDQIRLLSASEQRSIHESLQRIDPLPIDPVSRLLLAAGAYAQAGLNADAVAAYEQALQAQEVPEARVTLGDLYLASGLASRAEREYRQVLADAPDPAAQAAAEVGLGCVAYFRKRYHDSQEHFECAQEIYNSLGLTEEAEDARAAAARAQG
jgi:tetratricopeptide (TPR) repeat protein